MIHAQNSKVVNLLNPQSFGTSATVSATANAVGWDYAEILLHLATQTAANTDTITVSEGDGTSFATHADLAITTVAPDTSNAQLYKWFISLKNRKKNLKIAYQPAGTARIGSATITLSRGEQAPDSASERGVTAQCVAL